MSFIIASQIHSLYFLLYIPIALQKFHSFQRIFEEYSDNVDSETASAGKHQPDMDMTKYEEQAAHVRDIR